MFIIIEKKKKKKIDKIEILSKISEKEITITASVWIRTAFISWEKSTSFEKELLEAIEHLSKHGFVETEIRETPLVIK